MKSDRHPAKKHDDCPHWQNGQCRVAAALVPADCPTVAHLTACDVCTSADPPRAINRVTVSLAVSSAKHRPDIVTAILASHRTLLLSAAGAERLTAIIDGVDVGSQLWRLLSSLKIHHTPTCDCLTLAERMNALGPVGCRRERADLVAQMRTNASAYGWGAVAIAAGRAVVTGLVLHINPLDPYGSLLDEAIRRADEKPKSEIRNPKSTSFSRSAAAAITTTSSCGPPCDPSSVSRSATAASLSWAHSPRGSEKQIASAPFRGQNSKGTKRLGFPRKCSGRSTSCRT